jgi:hypothetical protein
MLVTELTLKKAFKKFWNEVKMPRPSYWSKELDRSFVEEFALPAFLKALEEIEDVDPCTGFDLKNIDIYG